MNFNSYITFIKALDVVLKQMGTLFKDHIPVLSIILVKGVLKLTKHFIGYRKIDENQEDLHSGADKQAKDCFRQGLGLVKSIYSKFSHLKDFISEFSAMVFDDLIKDQLSIMKEKYISQKSQLLEIMCLSWPNNENTM